MGLRVRFRSGSERQVRGLGARFCKPGCRPLPGATCPRPHGNLTELAQKAQKVGMTAIRRRQPERTGRSPAQREAERTTL
jgi:hypothetical protein